MLLLARAPGLPCPTCACSPAQFNAMRPFSLPEIQRVRLEAVVLQVRGLPVVWPVHCASAGDLSRMECHAAAPASQAQAIMACMMGRRREGVIRVHQAGSASCAPA